MISQLKQLQQHSVLHQAAVNTGTDRITITSHGTNTGDGLTYTEGTAAIGGLSTNTKILLLSRLMMNTIKLATTASNATNNKK